MRACASSHAIADRAAYRARVLIGGVLALTLLVGCAVAVSPSRSAANEADAGSITTPPPGSRERRAILDALRAELSHLTGPDLVFVVAVLRVRADWAWVEAEPQSRDGSNRHETVTALLQQQDGRWVVRVLGPCDTEDDPTCAEHDDPARLAARFPTLPPELVPRASDGPEEAGATTDGCRPPRLVRSPADWAEVFATLDWSSPRVSPPWWSAPSDDLRIVGRVVLDSARIPRDPACREGDDCRPRAVLAMPPAALPGVRCTRPLKLEIETFCERLELHDTLVRWRAFRWSLPPWFSGTIPVVQIIPACATPCPPGQVRCARDQTCWPSIEAHCLACLRKPPVVCACRDAPGVRPDGAACTYMISNDQMGSGQCRQGRCVNDDPKWR